MTRTLGKNGYWILDKKDNQEDKPMVEEKIWKCKLLSDTDTNPSRMLLSLSLKVQEIGESKVYCL